MTDVSGSYPTPSPSLDAPEELPTADQDEASSEGDGAARRKLPRPSRQSLLVAALVVSIALAAAFGALWFRARNPSAEQAGKFLTTQKPAVTSVARDVGTKLLNYDSTTIEGISKQMLAEATGSFFDDYQKAMQQGLKSALEKAKASSRGQILQGPDVSFQTPSVAVALLRVNQTTQSSGNPGGQSISYYLKITLVDTVDGGWKAEQVDVLSQQANQPPVPTG